MKTAIEKFWKQFLCENPEYFRADVPPYYYFCDNEKDANKCAELVLQDIKKATATSLWWFRHHGEELPKAGDISIVTNWEGYPQAIIKTTRIEQVPFAQVTLEFAQVEGEGDKSLNYWKEVHEAYYRREMEESGAVFHEDMIIICEYFEKIYPSK